MTTQTPPARFHGVDQQARPAPETAGLSDRLLKRDEVEAITTLSKTSIYAKVKTGEFPEPMRLGGRAVAWRESEVLAWIAKLQRAGLASLEA